RIKIAVTLRLFHQDLAQNGERRIDFALLALLGERAQDLPHVVRRREEITAVTRDVLEQHQVPALQFADTHGNVRPRHAESIDDLVGAKRLRRYIKKRIYLPYGAVDAPTAAHLPEVEHERLNDWRQFQNSLSRKF